MDCILLILSWTYGHGTYVDQIVSVCTTEIAQPNGQGQSVLGFEFLIELLPKILLDAQSLQYKDTHTDKALFRSVTFVSNGVEQTKYNKIVGTIRANNERPEPFIALQRFPKEHYDLWRPFDRLLTSRKIRRRGLHLRNISKTCARIMDANRLIKKLGHSLGKELKILWPMQSSKEMAVEILGNWATPIFGNRIEENDKEKLETINDERLLWIFPYHMVVGHSPRGSVVFHRRI